MVVQRTRYIETQEKRQEEALEAEEALLEDDKSPEDRPKRKGSRKALGEAPSLRGSKKSTKSGQTMETKYMNQLTLAMIESESLMPSKELSKRKPGTAEHNRMAATMEAPEEDFETIPEDSLTADREQEPSNAEGDSIQANASSAKNDWRQYFTIQELTTAFEKIQRGEDPNEDETASVDEVDNGSESCPSDDNLDLKELYGVIYGEKAKRAEQINAKAEVEAQYERDFAKFVKKMHKQARDASRDSGGSDNPQKGPGLDGSGERKNEGKKIKMNLVVKGQGQ